MTENIMKVLSLLGNVCSIVGLGLSIWLMVQTGKIKENVDKALDKNHRVINYKRMRKGILSGLEECAAYLVNEHLPDEQLPYLQKMDSYLSDFAACYPNMTADIEKDINNIRSSCDSKNFSYIKIIKPLHNIMSKLKMEVITP